MWVISIAFVVIAHHFMVKHIPLVYQILQENILQSIVPFHSLFLSKLELELN